jgi:hypothetical protein
MKGTSEDFVKSLKAKISKKEEKETFYRNLLQDSLDYFISIIKESNEIEIRSIKNFRTNEVSCFLNLYSENENIPALISGMLNKEGFQFNNIELDSKKSLYLINFGQRILTSGNNDNRFFFEFHFGGKYLFNLKITPQIDDLSYFVYESKYHSIKFWVCDHLNLGQHEISLRSVNRDKNKTKISLDKKYNLTISFDLIGEVEKINISKKIGRKKDN